jgi:hypothetical protein
MNSLIDFSVIMPVRGNVDGESKVARKSSLAYFYGDLNLKGEGYYVNH